MSNLAIIPARGGSRRIPRKNIRDFSGKPILAWSIEAAITSALFDEVMVSTDDREIAHVAEQYGAKVPFVRSAANADDHATLADVVEEVVNAYRNTGKNFENICCILPTAPLVSASRIVEAYRMLVTENFDSVCPIVKFSYPIWRALEFTADRKLRMIRPEYLKTRSQDLTPAFHDSGSFYWARAAALLGEKTLFCENGGAILLPETEVQDIDTETDWQIAEMKFKVLNMLT